MLVIIQEFIQGREVTCGVLDHGWQGSEFALLPTEIIPKKSHFFDYRAKYEAGASLEVTPPRTLPEQTVKKIQRVAEAVHRLSGAHGFSRVDMIVTHRNEPIILEINTIPGLTTESLLPKAAVASGITFPQFIDHCIHTAFLRRV